MAYKIFCIGCNGHEFKVDGDIFRQIQVLKLTCPKCKRVTVVYMAEDGEISVYEGRG